MHKQLPESTAKMKELDPIKEQRELCSHSCEAIQNPCKDPIFHNGLGLEVAAKPKKDEEHDAKLEVS